MTDLILFFRTIIEALISSVWHLFHRLYRYWVTDWWDPLLSWIYPPRIRCQACSSLLSEQAATALAEWFPDSPDLSSLPIPTQLTHLFEAHEAHEVHEVHELRIEDDTHRLYDIKTSSAIDDLKLLTRTFEPDALSISICWNCKGAVQSHTSEICSLCGRTIEANQMNWLEPLCTDCKGRSVSFVSARSFGPFQKGIQQWIARYKFGREMDLEPVLGHLLILAYWKYYRNLQIDGIVPVPLHPYRMKERGFNQAERLARFLVPYACVPCLELLERIDHSKAQTAYTKQGRVSGSKQLRIIPHEGFQLEGSQLLVIDDVYTTGTTVNTCSEVLKQAGTNRVYVLTLGR